jgi:hypothetical protein
MCWDIARSANLLEIGALYGWQWAKALYLQSLLGEPTARERALTIFEEAIRRGGRSAWFNRMRASLNRARRVSVSIEMVRDDYAVHLFQVFDDILENLGVRSNRFDKWCMSITDRLQSDSHAQFQEGLENLGRVLGYNATRPRYDTATDCRWRGVFHLTELAREAEASAGAIKIIPKTAILALWDRVRLVLSLYRDGWSLHDIPARRSSAERIHDRLPATGWLIRTIDNEARFLNEEQILAEWPTP